MSLLPTRWTGNASINSQCSGTSCLHEELLDGCHHLIVCTCFLHAKCFCLAFFRDCTFAAKCFPCMFINESTHTFVVLMWPLLTIFLLACTVLTPQEQQRRLNPCCLVSPPPPPLFPPPPSLWRRHIHVSPSHVTGVLLRNIRRLSMLSCPWIMSNWCHTPALF